MCTFVCCDNEFSDLLMDNLEDVIYYHLKGYRLFLHDDDQVYLKLKPAK